MGGEIDAVTRTSDDLLLSLCDNYVFDFIHILRVYTFCFGSSNEYNYRKME